MTPDVTAMVWLMPCAAPVAESSATLSAVVVPSGDAAASLAMEAATGVQVVASVCDCSARLVRASSIRRPLLVRRNVLLANDVRLPAASAAVPLEARVQDRSKAGVPPK